MQDLNRLSVEIFVTSFAYGAALICCLVANQMAHIDNGEPTVKKITVIIAAGVMLSISVYHTLKLLLG